jgi:glycolate oxidase FAD binding subunit
VDTSIRTIETVVGDVAVEPATAGDAIDHVACRLVAAPADAAELAALLARANASGLAVVPRGGGTKLAWGDPPKSADLVLSTLRLGEIVEHAAGDLTVTVQAGCTIDRLQRVLAEHRQRLALDPIHPRRATVGGVLATGDTGSLRGTFGPPRDQVIGITAALPDGSLARSGGRVVKNVAGYDLPKLFTGSLGTLGVITEATFRLHPLPHESLTHWFAFQDDGRAARFAEAVFASTLAPTGVQLRISASETAAVAVRVEGFAARSIEERVDRLRQLARVQDASADQVRSDGDGVWAARERLYVDAPLTVTGRLSFLPAELAPLSRSLREILAGSDWELVAQAVGVGEIRITAPTPEAMVSSVDAVRLATERSRGSFVVRGAPRGLKHQLNVWGPAGDALPLMRRIKERFDPRWTLNPGRFVGGI